MTTFAQLPLEGLAEQTAARADAIPSHLIPMPTGPVAVPRETERDVTPIAAKAAAARQRRAAAPPPRESECERLITFAEAARILGISLRHLRRLVDRGSVAYVRVSERSPRVRPSELRRFVGAAAVKHSEGSP